MKLKFLPIIVSIAIAFSSCIGDKDLYVDPDDKKKEEEEQKKEEEIKKGLLLSFKIEKSKNPQLKKDIEFIICENGKVVGWLNNETDISSLIPTFEIINGELYHNDTKQQSGQNNIDFSSEVTYTFKGNTGTERSYKVEITPYTGLPVVVINVENNKEIESKYDWLPSSLKIDGMGQFSDYIDNKAEVRGRGNTTWKQPKKPYNLRLSSKQSVVGMLPHKRWALIGNWMDRTLLRHHVSYHIASLTDLEWTPKGYYVELILNGKHQGIYYFCESIRVDKNRLNITELKPEDTSEEKLTGGYLLEFDTHSASNKFTTETYKLPVVIQNPDVDDINKVQHDYIVNYINNLEAELIKDDFVETRKYADYLDINSFADWWIVYELARNHEAVNPKSCYRYKDREGKLKAGPVWDFDWGTFTQSTEFVAKDRIWYDRLFQDPVFVETVKERWKRYKPKFETVELFIRKEMEIIRESEKINSLMWPLTDATEINRDEKLSFDEAVEKMCLNYANRLKWLDEEISKM